MTTHEVSNGPQSRRVLLGGLLGGLGAWAASVLSRAVPVEAAAGDPIRMGRTNRAGSTQTILEANSPGAAFMVRQSSRAQAIRAEAKAGRAVMGVGGSNGTGLWGYSPDHNAVFASTETGYCVNTRALGNGSVGVYTNAWGPNSVALISNGPSILNGSLAMNGPVAISGPVMLTEAGTPSAPATNRLVLFARDNGSGSTQLCVRFATGDVQVIATEL